MKIDESLSKSFAESIVPIVGDVATETAEIAIDSLLDEGIARNLPIVKYVAGAYHMANTIRDRFLLSKLSQFIIQFNSGFADEKETEKYRELMKSSKRDAEVEYLLIVLDRQLNYEKPRMLAELFIGYLDHRINWADFCSYSEVLDKLFIGDLQYLREDGEYQFVRDHVPAALLRLEGLGLVVSFSHDSPFDRDGQGGMAIFANAFERVGAELISFKMTQFGKQFSKLIVKSTTSSV